MILINLNMLSAIFVVLNGFGVHVLVFWSPNSLPLASNTPKMTPANVPENDLSKLLNY